MQAQGHRPDVAAYNVVIESLTRSGVLSGQLKAAQVFQTATRQGQLRCVRRCFFTLQLGSRLKKPLSCSHASKVVPSRW